jgi:hypothetical protein
MNKKHPCPDYNPKGEPWEIEYKYNPTYPKSCYGCKHLEHIPYECYACKGDHYVEEIPYIGDNIQ